MPNKLMNNHPHHQAGHHGKQHDAAQPNNKQLASAKNSNSNSNLSSNNSNNNNNGKHTASNGSLEKQQQQQGDKQQANQSSLNVAEMILHGVADHEILDTWLGSIACQEFAKNFVDAGYDMPTISRITPQDLTAIGITDPTKRLKILSEIKKLNLQDGIPTFKPASLSHWLSLLRLDSHYHKSLCDQQIDTIEKTCQLTWEDFEELGITKLGHQKRLLLAIERMKEIDAAEAKQMSQPMSEPIYDTSPSQILLVASAENHCMNGPIINKQSSTSELSSTGSGSMHSLYSANSLPHQPSYQTLASMQQQLEQHRQKSQQQQQQQLQQPIYSQPPSQMMPPPPPQAQTQHMTPQRQLPNGIHQLNQQQQQHHHQNSHYQAVQPHFINPIYDTSSNLNGRNTMINRQSLGQLPFSALANLPKHQQQLLQQSSIYATLSRQPQRVKQPPPPVPIRTNSLKSNSLIDEEAAKNHSSLQSLTSTQTNSASSLFRSGTRMSNRNQFNSQTRLNKNKSFSGGAYMDAARARFMNRNQYQFPNLPQQQQQQQQQQQPQQQHQMQPMINRNNSVDNCGGQQGGVPGAQNIIYGMTTNFMRQGEADLANGHLSNHRHPSLDSDNLSLYSRQSVPSSLSSNQASTMNLQQHQQQQSTTKDSPYQQQQQQQPPPPMIHQLMSQRHSIHQSPVKSQQAGSVINRLAGAADDYDRYSDTNSTKSLMLPATDVASSPVNSNGQGSSSQDSGSSQTLYNSASSGSNDQNINGCNFSQSRQSTVSSSTLNDVNLILDQQVAQNQQQQQQQQQRLNNHNQSASRLNDAVGMSAKTGSHECSATTGKDDDFPPPPSPLSLNEFDEHNMNSINSDGNFADISQRLMTFRVGT